MTPQSQYVCSECGKHYEIRPDLMLCPLCSKKQRSNEPLRGILEVVYTPLPGLYPGDYLPVDPCYFPQVPVGNTPLWKAKLPQAHTELYLKDDTGNLSASFKDRASILVAAFAIKHNIKEIAVASTGNAGSSMAAIAAAAGLKSTIFLPKNAPRAKMIQALQYGARLVTVDGNYDKAFDLSLEYSRKFGVLSRNTAYNPLTIEGKKTAAIEIFGQLGKLPDYVFIPCGDGVILSGMYKGFRDLQQYGFSDRIPTLVAVQAEGSAAIYQALQDDGKIHKVNSRTLADSIAVDVPRGGYYALQQLQRYGGRAVSVPDTAILAAQKKLSAQTGLFAEPAAAAAYAGYEKIKHELPEDAGVVLLITGSGLKDTDAAMKVLQFPEKAISRIEELA
jgi:threonine synthase